MNACRQCGAPVPPSQRPGRVLKYCSPACRTIWNDITSREKRRIKRGSDAGMHGPTYAMINREFTGRRKEIERTQTLRAQLDRLRAPRPRVPVRELLRRLELDGIRARRTNAQA